jgi:hypothetical protein
MKKTTLSLAAFFFTLMSLRAQIVITEIMYNPPPSGVDSLEYVEVFNNSGMPVNLSGWNFTQGFTFTFADGTIIPPGGYLVIAQNAPYFEAQFGFQPLAMGANSALTNTGEDIELRDAQGNVKDYVDYKPAEPWPTQANGGGPSMVLCDPNTDNSVGGAWQAATTPTSIVLGGTAVFANPGAPSDCGSGSTLVAADDNLVVTAGTPVNLNVLANDFTLNQVASLTIISGPSQGTATVNGDFTILYSTPATNCGEDELTYVVCDASICDTATAHIDLRCYPAYSIAQVTGETGTGAADSLGVHCELEGTVYGVNLRPINNNVSALLFTIIDDSGNGIAVSSLNGNFGYTVTEKDRVKVRGTIGQFSGQTEIIPDFITLVSANNTLLAPTPATAAAEATESKLIKISNLHFVDAAEWTTGVGASGFNVRAVSDNNLNDTIQIRIDRDVETYNAPVPAQPFDLTGIGGQFDATSPFDAGYQILPRYNADISTLNSAKEADFSEFVVLSPNPVVNVLHVNATISFDRIVLMGANGQQIESFERPDLSMEIAMAKLPGGMYFLHFRKGAAVWTTKFVKQ